MTMHAILRPGMIGAVIALVVTAAIGYFADHQNRAVFREQARAEVAVNLGRVRAAIESNINGNIQLVRGLVAVIASDPDVDQERFERIASALLGEHSQLRNIAAAPDLVIRLMYPLAGNERALGLNYMQHPGQRDAALAAMTARGMVLAGPVDLVQGGRGFIGRIPVFIKETVAEGQSVVERPWGLVSAVIDVDRFYEESGLLRDNLPIRVALVGRDADLSDTTVFFGDPDVLLRDPVVAEISMPTGGWRIAAVPREGWREAPPDALRFRTLLALAALAIILPVGVAGHFYDRHRAHSHALASRESEMRVLSQRLKLALETSQIGVWELDVDTGTLRWDQRMKELYGVADDATPDAVEHWKEKLHPEDRERAVAEFEEAIGSGKTYKSVFRVLGPDGAPRWIRTIGATHRDQSGRRLALGVNWDVSDEVQRRGQLIEAKSSAELRNRELEEARRQMEYNSLHDSLTGLPNRRFLDERVGAGDDGMRPSAMLHIDLDRFKHINDTLGHAAGDAMLVHAAEVLRRNTRDSDVVARIGGDEFVIATMQPTNAAGLAGLAERIIEEMRRPVPFQGHECRFGASIGIAVNERFDASTTNRLLIDADLALYRAKKRGRNRYEFFDASLKAEILSNKILADEILAGLERREFLPYFQPQFDARSLDIVGVEALARWRHPTRGLLAPGAFLAIAEELGVVSAIDGIILEETLWQSSRWTAAGIAIPRKSVNVSAGQLQDDALIERLRGLPIVPGELSFELLESIFLDEDSETATSNITRLAEMGIDIEIDDFGTGYASIVSLLQLRPKRLKIERRLIAPLTDADGQRRLVASIIDIGKSLGIEVVAEGVETMDHAAILRELSCEVLQGYALAAPMSSDDLIAFVRDERWRSASRPVALPA